ncbi:MAG: DsbC family protein [Acinetobacter populi]|jgi:thiol:disulfide interchange protein DsbC|uniref:DsbC family protein n=1 Tax=Acinetobacter populi TaxID=1582270 RepID=UPI0023570454|nr:DsbC family protein [Acinetobacter populi]MCH4246663.1 DsbC family protein [Acinetobacter populi]
MQFPKLAMSTLMIASAFSFVACSKQDASQKSSDEAITATTSATGEASTLPENNAHQRLMQTLQVNFDKAGLKAKILNIRNTEIANMYWVTLEGFPAVLATADGKYIFQGDVIRLGDKQIHHVSEDLQAADNKAKFAALNPKDLIIYPAQGKAKHIIYVFTDSSCPYCHKFHEHMAEMNQKGIEVRYIAWPRGEQYFPTMQSIWCSEDRKAAFDQSVSGIPVQAAQCDNPVLAQYQLGMNIGVNGTPAVYNADGKYLGGYIEPADLLKRLNEK